jgi:hypothetical protein
LEYLTTTLGMNVTPFQTWRIVPDIGVASKRSKLALEHVEYYEQGKNKNKKNIQNYKNVSAALLKKDSNRI